MVTRWPPVAIAAARALNAMFFFAVAAYGVLAYSPFAFEAFIKPDVIPGIFVFVSLSPACFWVVFLISVLTLLPFLRPPTLSRAAIAYVIVGGAVGVWMVFRPVLTRLDNGPASLVVALLALVAPVSLALVDVVVTPAPVIARANERRATVALLGAGALVWGVYTVAVPLRLRASLGIHLSSGEFAIALAGSAIASMTVFSGASLVMLAVLSLADLRRPSGRIDYGVLLVLLAASLGVVLYSLVCGSIAFRGPAAVLASGAMAGAVAVVWAGLGHVRVSMHTSRRIDAFALFTAPIVGGAPSGRTRTFASVVALTIVAFVLVDAMGPLDWNFLLQKLGVLVVWIAAVAVVHAAATDRHWTPRIPALAASALVLAICGSASFGLSRLEAATGENGEFARDRYTALDPSYRLIRDARTVPSGASAAFYAYLRSNTLIQWTAARPSPIDFVVPLGPSSERKPLIFLFVIDSLRRDYLSAYNPAVTFTPEIGRLAADSVVFDRAFTRYAGTNLAVPSIWAGGMLIHELELHDFGSRNALLKLLDVNGYHLAMTRDTHVKDLVPQRSEITELDRGLNTMQIDFCRTVAEVRAQLEAGGDSRPLFVYTLPQNVHIAVASRRKVPQNESYPGFFAPVASSVRVVDRCLGGFVDYLKTANLYDRSLIMLTADHGDSLGEEGRFGHALFMYPEVMRVPLIVHLPSWMKARETADRTAVAMTTDIVPTLYELLGYTPADRGALFGQPLFGRGAAPKLRPGPFLIASSYGAIYGTLADNGRQMYAADAVDARDFAFDLRGDGPGERLALTADITAVNRQVIRDQLTELAALNHFVPQ
jgi:Sulfatase